MDHGFKLHPDGTLEITLPQGTKVKRVIVHEAGTQNGSLYYPESDVHDINDGNISSSQCHENDLISRQAAIDTSLEFFVEYLGGAFDENSQKELMARLQRLPSAEPEIIRCKDCKYYCNVLYSGTQFECGQCCRTFIEDVKPNDYCSRAERRTNG